MDGTQFGTFLYSRLQLTIFMCYFFIFDNNVSQPAGKDKHKLLTK